VKERVGEYYLKEEERIRCCGNPVPVLVLVPGTRKRNRYTLYFFAL
jgi:hypothetical protein